MSRKSACKAVAILSIVSVLTAFPVVALAAGPAVKSVSAGHILVLAEGNASKTVVLEDVWSPAPSTPVGQEARDFTAQRVLGENVTISQGEQREGVTYVSVVLSDGQPLSKLLVAKGLARWNGHKGELCKELEKAQQSARDQGLGIWGNPYGTPSTEYPDGADASKESALPPVNLGPRPHQILTMKGDPAVTAAVRSQFEQEKSERLAKRLQEEAALQAAEEAQWLAAQQPPPETASQSKTGETDSKTQAQPATGQPAAPYAPYQEPIYDYPPEGPYGPGFVPWGYYEPPIPFFDPLPYGAGPSGYWFNPRVVTYISPR